MAGDRAVAALGTIGLVVCGWRGWCLAGGGGQLVVAVVARQSLSRLWVPHSSFHSA
jgi:hypothetical protein